MILCETLAVFFLGTFCLLPVNFEFRVNANFLKCYANQIVTECNHKSKEKLENVNSKQRKCNVGSLNVMINS